MKKPRVIKLRGLRHFPNISFSWGYCSPKLALDVLPICDQYHDLPTDKYGCVPEKFRSLVLLHLPPKTLREYKKVIQIDLPATVHVELRIKVRIVLLRVECRGKFDKIVEVHLSVAREVPWGSRPRQ